MDAGAGGSEVGAKVNRGRTAAQLTALAGAGSFGANLGGSNPGDAVTHGTKTAGAADMIRGIQLGQNSHEPIRAKKADSFLRKTGCSFGEGSNTAAGEATATGAGTGVGEGKTAAACLAARLAARFACMRSSMVSVQRGKINTRATFNVGFQNTCKREESTLCSPSHVERGRKTPLAGQLRKDAVQRLSASYLKIRTTGRKHLRRPSCWNPDCWIFLLSLRLLAVASCEKTVSARAGRADQGLASEEPA